MDRVVVEYLHLGDWIWSRDYPGSMLEEAKEYGRKLWRDGVAGVRITHYQPVVVVEEIRSPAPASPGPARTPRTTHDQRQ